MPRADELYSFLLKVASKDSRTIAPRAVHALRTTSRRLQSLLAAQTNRDDKLYKQLRKIRRQAGTVRDLDVQLAALKTLDVPFAATEQDRVIRALQRKRRKSAQTLREFLLAYRPRLRAAFAAEQLGAKSSTSAKKARNRPVAPDALAKALTNFATSAENLKIETTDDLHAFRIVVKKARYTAELAGDEPEAVSAIDALKQIQDAIGEWHDLWLLANTADEVLGHRHNSALVGALSAEVRKRHTHARRVAARKTKLLLEMHAALSGAKRPAASKRTSSRAARAM